MTAANDNTIWPDRIYSLNDNERKELAIRNEGGNWFEVEKKIMQELTSGQGRIMPGQIVEG